MNQTQPNLLQLAKQGNAKAIATLINRQLQPKGITAKAIFKDSCLQIMLESAQVPNQQALVAFIRKGITSLETESIQKIKIYGRQKGEEFPAWSEEIELAVQPLPSPSQTVSQSRTTYETQNKSLNHAPSKTPIKTKSSKSSMLKWANLKANPFVVTSQKFLHFPRIIKVGVVGTVILAISIPIVIIYNSQLDSSQGNLINYNVEAQEKSNLENIKSDSSPNSLTQSDLDERYKLHLEELIKTQLKNDEDIVDTMKIFQDAGGFNASKERALTNCKTLAEGTLKEELLEGNLALPEDSKALKDFNLDKVEHRSAFTDKQMRILLRFNLIHGAEVFAAQTVYCPDTRKDFSIKD
jgi:hypothetical protein